MRLRFVTGNRGKAEEAAAALKPLGIEVEQHPLPHPEVQADTLEEVARERALWLRGQVETPYFVDDAGLFVDALNGFPGVYSAYVYRTLGWQGVLKLLEGHREPEGRTARFEAVVAHVADAAHEPVLHKGVCPGRILSAPRGSKGFGFDPVFAPQGQARSFAEMGLDEKNPLSHRGKALAAFAEGLRRG